MPGPDKSKVALGFVPAPKLVPLDKVLPSRKVPQGLLASRKYRQIYASIQEIGLIEPIAVSPIAKSDGLFAVLDGHIRLLALRELGVAEVPCLEALDDESYTYNSHVNRLSSIQEHYMIRRALQRGVTADRLAKALNVDISQVLKKAHLLEGICPEARSLLEDRRFSTEFSRVIRQMKPTRQVECVELMVSADNLTVPYAEALLAATSPELLIEGKKPRKVSGVTTEQMARMEREMGSLQSQYRLVEQSFGQDVLTLVLIRGYLAKLIANAEIAKFLSQRSPEILEQFELIAATASLDGQ